MYEIGRVLYEEDKYEESEEWLANCFQRSLKTLGSCYKLTAWSCRRLGICYEGQGRYADAQALYQKLLKELPRDHLAIPVIQ